MLRRLLLPLFLAVVGLGAITAPLQQANAGGGCRGVPSTAAAGDAVTMADHSCFTPTVLFTEPGATVTWTNESTEIHDVGGATLEWGSYEDVGAGESVSYRFDQPGTYPYYCFVHNGMMGAIVVGDGAFVADAAGGAQVSAAETLTRQPIAEGAPDTQGAAPAAVSATGSAVHGGRGVLVAGLLGALLGAVGVAAAVSLRGTVRG